MGQSASTQRDREDFLNRDSRRLSQLLQGRIARDNAPSRDSAHPDQPGSGLNPAISQPRNSHSLRPFATFSRQISAQSIPVARGGPTQSGNVARRDEIFYEQQEERPLVHMEDLGMRNAPITHITASPMPRQSRMSRLSSLITPRYAASESSSSDDYGYGERLAQRRRTLNRDPLDVAREEQRHRTRRSTTFGSLSIEPSANSRSRRRRGIAPISRPFPLDADATMPQSAFTTPPLHDMPPRRNPTEDANTSGSRTSSAAFSARLSRVRRSISSSFEAFPSILRHTQSQDHHNQMPPQRPPRMAISDDSDYLLPPLNVTDPSIDLGDSVPSALRPEREPWPSGIHTVSESPERAATRADGPTWTERWAERSSVGRRDGRRMPGMLRGRSGRLIRRDNDGPLPRILSLAASAIAAQLSGSAEQTLPDMQAVGPDDLDGSLNSLFRTLQNATNLAGESSTSDGGHGPSRSTGSLPPLNFLRVFRFVSQTTSSAAASDAPAAERLDRRTRADNQSAAFDNFSEAPDSRTVTLVVVGVRSVPSEHVGHEDTPIADPSLDSLLNLPSPSTNLLRSGAGGLLRHANGRSRFPHRRRASSGAINTFPANYDSQRHQRTLSGSRSGSVDATYGSGSTTPTAATPPGLSDSPPGPHPPPSTPADLGLSAYNSQATTPSRRPSSASAIQQSNIPLRDIATQHLREAGISTPDDQVSRAVQQRRRSDSDFARHRNLGSGAARRNGVVGPDDVEVGDPPSSGSRSWLIYVVGTNLSEDHPALATPSLFTDVSCSVIRMEEPYG